MARRHTTDAVLGYSYIIDRSRKVTRSKASLCPRGCVLITPASHVMESESVFPGTLILPAGHELESESVPPGCA